MLETRSEVTSIINF